MSTTIPEPWSSLLEQRGITSIRALSRKSGLSVETTRKALLGLATPRLETIQALAEALQVSVPRIETMLGDEYVSTARPYAPPAEADRMTRRQRVAIDEMIRLLVAGNRLGEVKEETQQDYDLVADDAPDYEDEDVLREMEP